MDLYNFQTSKEQLAQQSREREAEVKEKAEKAQEKYNENVRTPLEMVSGSAVEDTSLDLLKNGIKRLSSKTAEKLGISKDTVKSFTDKLDKIDKKELLKNPKKAIQEAFKGEEDEGIQNLLKKTLQENLKKIVPEKVQDIIPSITRDIKGNTKKLGKLSDNITGKIDNLGGQSQNIADVKESIKSLDPDIAKALPINPSIKDLQSAQLRQGMRDIGDKSLTLKDDLTNAQRGSGKLKVKVLLDDTKSALDKKEASLKDLKSNIKDKFKSLSDSDKIKAREEFENRFKQLNIKQPTSREDILNAREQKLNLQKDTVNKYKSKSPDIEPENTKAVNEKFKPTTDADADDALQDVKSVAKKAGEKLIETDAELGGPEDPLGDIVAGVVALGSMIFGIKHKPKPPPIPIVQKVAPTLQLGLDTA
jgi:hypothetical protein